ncbi:MAG TPA: glycosyltransferase family 39 protein [Sphingomonas sp.]|nr:glycosyltransferase family 39 protein [Sphingomonas sp.]
MAIGIGWVGYSASDDANYYEAALRWLDHPPVAGDDHWATRFPLILSLAGMIALLGKGATAMGATALGWYVVFVASVRGLAARIAGSRAGWIAALLMATMPVVVTNATTVSCDLAEASFLILGIALAGDSAAGQAGGWRPAVAGLAFGGAILCRETTALALFGVVPLFLAGRPIPRRALIVMTLACAGLLAGEAAFQYALTGDPLHRWTLAFHHDGHIDRAANLEGNVLLYPPIDPLLVLLVNDDFALVFWLAGAALAWRFHRRLDREGRARMLVVVAFALATFLLVGALTTKLVLNPRYFMLPAIAAALAVAIWLDGMRPAPRAVLLAITLGANASMLSVENQHPRWPAEALLLAAERHPGETIATDAETHHRALIPLGWHGLDHVVTGEGVPGGLVLIPEGPANAGLRIVERYPSSPSVLGSLLDRLGVVRHLPHRVAARLLVPNPTMVLAVAR